MTLSLALGNALSGLRVAQASLASVSHNIANANNEDHSREIVEQSALVLDNVGSGVQIDQITRKVDHFISRSIRQELANTGRSDAISEYMGRLQLFLGEPGADNSLNAYIDNFFNSLQDLAQNPERASLKQAALQSATTLTNHINNVARNAEDLRFEADQDIVRAITTINTSIDELYRINKSINIAAAKDQSVASLLDRRDAELRKIADLIDIKISRRDDGQVYVSAGNGLQLLDDQRYVLDYLPAQSINTFINSTQLDRITVTAIDSSGNRSTFSETLVNYGVEGSVDSRLSSGRLLGLVEMRDVEIPKILNTLDQFATVLTDEFNAIHNTGSGIPPNTSFTGTLFAAPDQVREWTGTFRMAALDSTGNAWPNPYDNTPPGNIEVGNTRPLNLHLGFDSGENGVGRHETQTIIDEINAYYGPQQKKVHINNLNDIRLVVRDENNPATGTLNFDFSMENVSLDTAQVEILGVVPSAGAVSIPANPAAYNVIPGFYGRSGTDRYFQLNGLPAAAFTVDVQVRVTNSTTGDAVTTTIQYTVDPTVTDIKNDRYIGSQVGPPPVVVGTPPVVVVEEFPVSPSGLISARLVDSTGSPVASGVSGYLQVFSTLTNVHIALDDNNSQDLGQTYTVNGATPTNRGVGHYFGLNNFFVETYTLADTAINLGVRSDLQSNSGLISTSSLTQSAQPADPTLGPLYTYELGAGNAQIIQRLADLSLTNLDYAASGLLPVTSQTLSSYAGSLLGVVASNTNFADLKLENNEFILQGFKETDLAIRGVNVDEELANTIIYQNAYTAATRVINVVDELFDALIQST